MTFQSWVLYLTLVTIATATPGPAVLFITTSSLAYGWKKTIFSALGNVIGLLLLGIVAIAGLGTVLKSSIAIYSCVKYIGAMYLVYLGIKLLFANEKNQNVIDSEPKTNQIKSKKLFIQSFGIAVSNPKAVVFLTALLPQFITIEDPLVPQFSTLILVLMSFSFSFLMCYSLLAHQAKGWLTAESNRKKIVNRVSGSIFIGFGVLLGSSSNQ